ncbi:uncharacterized protein [Physcomitrium patens]|uniref:HMA domain-containing protein n=1 Tax=Physcomitrium patens TaxID=3218 RepID=A0A2K1JKM4_PHYPA|nr:heavy metal-associated isoprenylated plant protein 20-like [Physcomitrium patens]PNR42091.1 hypothetical protein PHYPA_016920 [Physcomitrium patens]|eukprot:XP_024392339.1 heavy metal-associated isoprenylated plant protein 20-like [Physcomitrella patens]
MCCTRCEDQVRDALYALRGVEGVVCDLYNQRVTVAGYLEPALALQQLRRVKNGASFCSQISHGRQHRYEVSLYQKSHSGRQDQRDRKAYAQLDTIEQRSHSENRYNCSSSESYSRSFCPSHRDTTGTHYVSVPNPMIATRVEWES